MRGMISDGRGRSSVHEGHEAKDMRNRDRHMVPLNASVEAWLSRQTVAKQGAAVPIWGSCERGDLSSQRSIRARPGQQHRKGFPCAGFWKRDSAAQRENTRTRETWDSTQTSLPGCSLKRRLGRPSFYVVDFFLKERHDRSNPLGRAGYAKRRQNQVLGPNGPHVPHSKHPP